MYIQYVKKLEKDQNMEDSKIKAEAGGYNNLSIGDLICNICYIYVIIDMSTLIAIVNIIKSLKMMIHLQ